jgi:hypothetical protein
LDYARAYVVDPAVQVQDLVVAPGILHNCGFGQVKHLFLNVSFYKPVPSFLFVLDPV